MKMNLKKKTDIALNRLKTAGMTINKKCVINWRKISFLGYTIPKEGISPDQGLIKTKYQKLLHQKIKKNWTFLRLVNFYWRYVPKYTDFTDPFASLSEKELRFIWSEKQQKFLID